MIGIFNANTFLNANALFINKDLPMWWRKKGNKCHNCNQYF
jgi:hypothetical protein